MMHETRWQVEREIMKQHFPGFATVNQSGSLGFYGSVRGPSTGRWYLIVAKIPAARYPQTEPAVYIEPRVGAGWEADTVNLDPRGKLSICRDTPWNPCRNTFASCVLCAVQYVKEYDK